MLEYVPNPGDPPMLHGRGCEYCNKRGYKGRTGVYEMLELTDVVKEQILNQASASEIRRAGLFRGRNYGMTPS